MLFVNSVFAQTNNEKTGALLWKISGNRLKQPSYIFGTHHLYPSSLLDSIAGVKQAFFSSKQMIGEYDMADLLVEGQKASMMPQDTTWQMLLSADDYHFVDEQLIKVLGVGLQSFEMLKPSVVSAAYAMSFGQKTFPPVVDETIDTWFQQQAEKRGIPFVGLDTLPDLTASFFTPLKRQAADLVSMLRNSESVEFYTKESYRLYRLADLKGIEMFGTSINETRHKRWFGKLPTLMSDKPSFIVVGIGHLVGEFGLLVVLEQLGYTVEAVVELHDED